MQLQNSLLAYNTNAAFKKSCLLPVITHNTQLPLCCSNCSFINHPHYNFCTNCGYPVHPDKDRLALYNLRMEERKKHQKKCSVKIEHARNALYVLAACCMFGVFYVFSDMRQSVITGLVMIVLGAIYAGLGRWSLQKPFTSLLISLIIMLTFAAINTLTGFSSAFTTAGGVYMLLVQIVLIYFLLRGVKGAFHADILEEEFKV